MQGRHTRVVGPRQVARRMVAAVDLQLLMLCRLFAHRVQVHQEERPEKGQQHQHRDAGADAAVALPLGRGALAGGGRGSALCACSASQYP